MLKSKSIDILKTFSTDEFKRFTAFVASPYFNTDKSIIPLVAALKKFYPDFSSEKLTETYLYEKVYGKGKFSYSTMKNLMSVLILLCEKFLVHDRLTKELTESNGNSIKLLQELRERKIDSLFNSRSKKLEELFGKHTIENGEYFIQATRLEILKYHYYLNKHRYSKNIWEGFLKKSTLELCSIFHTLYLTTVALLHSAEILKGSSGESIMIKFVKDLKLEKFLKTFRHDESQEYFFVSLYAKLILLSLNESKVSDNFYFEIKRSFIKNIKYFSNVDIYNILKSLRSFCIYRMKSINKEFIDEMFEVNKLLAERVDYSSGAIRWFIGEIFTEIVSLSIYKKKYAYAEEFIEKFKNHLNSEISEFETGYNKAFLNLEYGNIEKALRLLSVLKPVNSYMNILIKNLYLRIYFELGYFEEALTLLDAYKHFVNKEQKFSDETKCNYNRRHKIFLGLFRIKMNPEKYSQFEIAALGKELDKFYFLADKEWYLRKMKELDGIVQ